MTTENINKLILSLLATVVITMLFGCSYFQNDPPLDFSEERIKEIDQVVNTLYENMQIIIKD